MAIIKRPYAPTPVESRHIPEAGCIIDWWNKPQVSKETLGRSDVVIWVEKTVIENNEGLR